MTAFTSTLRHNTRSRRATSAQARKQAKAQQGFTLIELSIVLVIIGLIVGGVLVGQDLIKAAELRATISQIEKYETAVNTFRNKYNGLPGDLSNASTFGTAFTQAGATGLAGNGLIESCTASDGAAFGCENKFFWNHLYAANMIETAFTDTTANTNFPSAAITNTSTVLPTAKMGRGNQFYIQLISGIHHFRMASFTNIAASTGVATTANSLSPNEAYQIDTKRDDGLADKGAVQGVDATNNGTTLAPTGTNTCLGASSQYQMSVTTQACQLRIRASF